MERINEYRHKSRILRQIHSNKSKKYGVINGVQNVITVVVSSFITFIGFYGVNDLHLLINKWITIDVSVFEFLFNLFVFILFINVILHLVFHFNNKQSESDKAIVLLTSLINEANDIIEKWRTNPSVISENIIDLVRHKYLTITSVIPANTDKEFLKAKKSINEKEKFKNEAVQLCIDIFDEKFLNDHTSYLIKNSILDTFLRKLRDVNTELYLGGGAVRNLVWDELHGYTQISQIADLDIIYFDKLCNSKEHDKRIEEQLFKVVPNIKWSVKNQARMHIWNNEEEYESINDAISKWPETCTAIAVRMKDDDSLEYILPFGLSDLYRLIVVPTPHFMTKINKYKERIAQKNWIKTWNKLKIIGV